MHVGLQMVRSGIRLRKKHPRGTAGHRSPEIITFPIAPGKKVVFPGLIMGGRISQVKKNQGLSHCGMVGFWDGRLKEMVPEMVPRDIKSRRAFPLRANTGRRIVAIVASFLSCSIDGSRRNPWISRSYVG